MSISGDSRRILRTAIFSRLLVFSLMCLWRLLLHPYDTSAALNPPCLGRSVVWDGVHFLRIAECDYEYEQTFAFFPALPVFISLLARSVFAPLVPLLGFRAVLALAGYALNNAAFLIAAVYFYRLSVLVLRDEAAAYRASMLFCFNPASVFYSSIYSESLYAWFSLGGVFHLLSGSNAMAVLLLALSGLVRSNGALNAGYYSSGISIGPRPPSWGRSHLLCSELKGVAAGGLKIGCVMTPLVFFQAYGYAKLCLGRDPKERRPWCGPGIPRLYGYVQSHYWDVGFLRYFQVKQLPNFLLASPMLLLATCSIMEYVRLRPEAVLSLGLRAPAKERKIAAATSAMPSGEPIGRFTFMRLILNLADRGRRRGNQRLLELGTEGNPVVRQRRHGGRAFRGYSSLLVLPFVYHLAFMAAVAFFVMHVQVATRFLSASPPIYWFAAGYVGGDHASLTSRLIVVYFATFLLLGSLLFSNFYPFT
ncbi:unnamed protein product [Spirodela intermedia]|uniref:GPI mannosyltransferase 2 n=1 Tax=Spirodela intermedia TaxID=51605 RepID=A0A7I8IMZ6_SPIIN|nr:unnamed protein product [Spirodela intermedia]CAA6659346.1 unnamed protein product [Spirodela intermedia]